MPHYEDGQEAQLGDLVQGKGYKVPHEIIGRVVNIRPGESCTLSVAHVGCACKVEFTGVDPKAAFAPCEVKAEVEYGDTKGFKLLRRVPLAMLMIILCCLSTGCAVEAFAPTPAAHEWTVEENEQATAVRPVVKPGVSQPAAESHVVFPDLPRGDACGPNGCGAWRGVFGESAGPVRRVVANRPRLLGRVFSRCGPGGCR